MGTIDTGVVGVGSLGYHHVRILEGLDGCRLIGLYDTDADRARAVAAEFETRATETFDELIDACDAVIVAVPTVQHCEVASAALRGGCSVLIEKPIASDLAEADRLVGVAREAGRIIQVGHVERFNGAVRACEPYLEDPLFVESHRLAPFGRRGTDVPVVLDLMIHDIDLILSLVGRPVADLRAVGVPVMSGSVDIANARLEFENAAVANITASRVSIQRQRKIRFFQPSGYISLDLDKGSGEFYRRTGPLPVGAVDVSSLAEVVERISLEGDGREPLELELRAFLAAVRGDAPVRVSGEEGRRALAVALEIVERIQKHHDHVFDSTSTPT